MEVVESFKLVRKEGRVLLLVWQTLEDATEAE
jgi:hypothetical protein